VKFFAKKKAPPREQDMSRDESWSSGVGRGGLLDRVDSWESFKSDNEKLKNIGEKDILIGMKSYSYVALNY
jgi:hypothetical protein